MQTRLMRRTGAESALPPAVQPLAHPALKRAPKYQISGNMSWICAGYSNRCLNKPPCFLSSGEALEYVVNLTSADGRDHSFNITIN